LPGEYATEAPVMAFEAGVKYPEKIVADLRNFSALAEPCRH
jgi:hypothetical protein